MKKAWHLNSSETNHTLLTAAKLRESIHFFMYKQEDKTSETSWNLNLDWVHRNEDIRNKQGSCMVDDGLDIKERMEQEIIFFSVHFDLTSWTAYTLF